MKTFVKIVLGNLVALILFGFVVMAFIGVVMTALFMGEEPTRVPGDSILVFDLSANITDSPPAADLWQLIGESIGPAAVPTYSLRGVTSAIRAAATDDRVSALYIHGNLIPESYGSGFSALRELRQAFQEFKTSGKPLISYVENPTVRDYYLASVADQIVMNPYGLIGLNGLVSQQFFITGALERYGVGVQVTRVGNYKAAVEMFTETEMSEANREQMAELMGDLWGEVLEGIGESRSISVEDLQGLADARGFIEPERALASNLVDRVGYLDEALEELRRITETEAGESFPQVDMNTYAIALEESPARRSGPKVAVVYVEGEIVDGEGGAGSVGGTRFAREIRRLRQDENVRAIVLRVNSPGGSVSASENIQREVRLARETKPVVVSFGTVAASGGYWVSADSDRIFAQPTTITGSIGVFGIMPNFQELANRHGVTLDEVKTATFADVFSMGRPKTEQEMARIQEMVDEIYQKFLDKVAEGRGMPMEEVRALAEGRVWSGTDALRLNLVDEIGGLREAIAFAGAEAGLETWDLVEFPRPADMAEVIAEMLSPERAPLAGRGQISSFLRDVQADYSALQNLNDPRGIYVRLPFSLRIR